MVTIMIGSWFNLKQHLALYKCKQNIWKHWKKSALPGYHGYSE